MAEKKFQFNFIAFIVAFGIGILYVYMVIPKPKVIIKYPTPYNAGNVVYRDSADTCFVFDANKTECPLDKSKIKKQPIADE